jgi:hypothetical protein
MVGVVLLVHGTLSMACSLAGYAVLCCAGLYLAQPVVHM